MPNHVTTRCTVTGQGVDISHFRNRMITTVTDEAGEPYTRLDFDRIIPMPKSALAVEENGLNGDVLALLCGCSGMVEIWHRLRAFPAGAKLGPWKGLFGFEKGEIAARLEEAWPGCVAKARATALCFGETGYKSWYDWSIAKWGTKWNSYSFSIIADEPFQFKFDTAWSFPVPVFEAIALEYPTLHFHCMTFDEGWNFGGEGFFNPPEGMPTWRQCAATDELYERVYGKKPEHDDEEAATA